MPDRQVYVRFSCPRCERIIRAKAKYAGKAARCPGCEGEIAVPHGREKRASPPPAAPPLTPDGSETLKLAQPVTASEYRSFLSRAREVCPRLEAAVERVLALTADSAHQVVPASVQLQRDLAFVASAVCQADDDWADSEMLMMSDVLLWGSGSTSAMYLDPLKSELRQVRTHLPNLVDTLRNLGSTGMYGFGWSFEDDCRTVIYLATYDAENGTAYAAEFVKFALHFCDMLAKADSVIGDEEKAEIDRVAEWLQRSMNAPTVSNLAVASSPEKVTGRPTKGLKELLSELHSLTGLTAVKQEVDDLVAFLKVQGMRAQRGLGSASISRHLVFYGNPGTGKTTVARLLSQIYASLGYLSKGHLVETDRSGLVAGFVGQTAIKTLEVCRKALGGVLFIDEAYSLVNREQDYGQEAIDTLLKFMEDNRGDLVVVVAGYPDRMAELLNSNPGIRSRFTRFLNFADYTSDELGLIFSHFCREGGFVLTDNAAATAQRIFEAEYSQRDHAFGNARFARNLFEQSLVKHARRITRANEICDGMLTTLEAEDICG